MGVVIGAQMYTLREFCKTPEDLENSLTRVAKMGYKAVQLSGVCEYDADWMKALLDRLGLVAPVTHTAPKKLLEDLDKVIADHKIFGAPYIGLGAAPRILSKEEPIPSLTEVWNDFLRDFTPVVKKISEAGLRFFYHHHAAEFVKLPDGRLFIDALCEQFTPEELGIIVDTYWVQAGGADPAAWIRKLNGRIKCIHFKDMAYSREDRGPHMAAIGDGNINWESVFAAVRDCDIEYAFVEQDKCYGEDPFDCLERSLKFIRAAGFAD
ncbi:MAG: sugar phosphate isomerase/epimerase [Clostridia bacterium]|nr:sugar phosphate isomerase/epimerase [Clostridia bacterium]